MREIKFRGRFWNKDNLDASECEYRDGEFIYGGYARLKNSSGTGDYIVTASRIGHLVYPDSVAQLIGHDKNGAEIYEGDTLIDDRGAMAGIATTMRVVEVELADDCRILTPGLFSNLTLAEAE